MEITHSPECWRLHTHHACAVAKIERLQAVVNALRSELCRLPPSMEHVKEAAKAAGGES